MGGALDFPSRLTLRLLIGVSAESPIGGSRIADEPPAERSADEVAALVESDEGAFASREFGIGQWVKPDSQMERSLNRRLSKEASLCRSPAQQRLQGRELGTSPGKRDSGSLTATQRDIYDEPPTKGIWL